MSCKNCNTNECNCNKTENMKTINNFQVKVQKLNEKAHLPTRGSAAAAGYDLYAAIGNHINIGPHETTMIGTGLAFELPSGTFGAIYPRSGIASKRGLRLANCVAVIDSDYRGEVKIALHNDSNEVQKVEAGERIAQIVLESYLPMSFEEVDKLSDTERGVSGFGSTGEK